MCEGGGNSADGDGAARRGRTEQVGAGVLVANAETPLLEVIGRANKNSLNMMAECLCKRLEHDASPPKAGQAGGSWDSDNGTAAVMAYVTGIGRGSELGDAG